MYENLLRCVVHGVTNDEGASLCRTGTVVGVGIDLMCRLFDRPTHEIDMSNGMPKLGDDKL